MKSCYLVTGAGGHLGSTILRQLSGQPVQLRGLAWPALPARPVDGVSYYVGDIRDPESLRPFFAGCRDMAVFLIHTAGLVDLSSGSADRLRAVNVEGTAGLLKLSREYGVRRFLYVSSVHALDPGFPGQVLTEQSPIDPDRVSGDYARSKALATRMVLEANGPDLRTLAVLPSGILGPGENRDNHLVRLLDAYLRGHLRFCVRGGYNFVDVRDVARGCIRAVTLGGPGEIYLLTGRHYEIRELLNMVRSVRHRPRPLTLPLWLAKAAAPGAEKWALRRNRLPLYTPYSLCTLRCNDRFSHDKAAAQLGFSPRDLRCTVRDTVLSLLESSSAPKNTDFRGGNS